MFRKQVSYWLAVGFVFFQMCSSVYAQTFVSPEKERFLSIILENDVFFETDGGYTNGLGVVYGEGPLKRLDHNNLPGWVLAIYRASYLDTLEDRAYAKSVAVGQVMNTPEDLRQSNLISDQQPYSGILLGRYNLFAVNAEYTDRLGIYYGIVGPLSNAGRTQKFIHSLSGAADPQGWDNQLKNEPGFRIELGRTKKFHQGNFTDNLTYELNWNINGGFGNLSSSLGAGLGFRLGKGISSVANIATEVPGRDVNIVGIGGKRRWYVFAELYGRYVFNDIAIQGNTFRDSHGVELIHTQAHVAYGVSFAFQRWAFSYFNTFLTDVYEDQPESPNFGAINFTYRYE